MGEAITPIPKEEKPAEEPGNDTGEKKEDDFKYVLAGQFGRVLEFSRDGKTVKVLVKAWSGDPEMFHGGGAESLRPYYVKMSREGYEAFRKAGSGEIGYIVAKEDTSDGTLWITQAALDAEAREDKSTADQSL